MNPYYLYNISFVITPNLMTQLQSFTFFSSWIFGTSGLGAFHDCLTYTVDYRLFVTWFNDISDLTSKFFWSQIFAGFCNANFTWFNDTWYNSQTWFKVTIFRSLGIFSPDLVTLTFYLCDFFILNFHWSFDISFLYIKLKTLNTKVNKITA